MSLEERNGFQKSSSLLWSESEIRGLHLQRIPPQGLVPFVGSFFLARCLCLCHSSSSHSHLHLPTHLNKSSSQNNNSLSNHSIWAPFAGLSPNFLHLIPLPTLSIALPRLQHHPLPLLTSKTIVLSEASSPPLEIASRTW